MSARIDCSFVHRDLQAASLHNNITRKVLNLMLIAVHKKNQQVAGADREVFWPKGGLGILGSKRKRDVGHIRHVKLSDMLRGGNPCR